jgi:hypothetical protein
MDVTAVCSCLWRYLVSFLFILDSVCSFDEITKNNVLQFYIYEIPNKRRFSMGILLSLCIPRHKELNSDLACLRSLDTGRCKYAPRITKENSEVEVQIFLHGSDSLSIDVAAFQKKKKNQATEIKILFISSVLKDEL